MKGFKTFIDEAIKISFSFGIIIVVKCLEFINFEYRKIIIDIEHHNITNSLGNSLKILEVLCKFISLWWLKKKLFSFKKIFRVSKLK